MMTTMTIPRYLLWLALAALIVGLDYATKHLASQTLELYHPIPLASWLNLTLAHNEGAAFSFLAGAGGWQRWFFAGVAGVIALVLLVWLWRLPVYARLLPASLALILGGAVGNLIDRVRYGYVVDFIDVHYAGWHWPAFNVADSAITIGIVLLLLEAVLPQGKSRPE